MIRRVRINRTLTQSEFLKFAPVKQRAEIKKLAEQLRGIRVVHVNATDVGGGVAELMESLIPYLRALGVQSDWYAIDSTKVPKGFFQVTNKIHNALQGAPLSFTKDEWGVYERVNKKVAEVLDQIDCDVLVVNDPQPLLAGSLAHRDKPTIYYSHIDTSAAYRKVWDRLFPAIKTFDKVIFSNKDFAHGSIAKSKLHFFAPAIDPLAAKQTIVPQKKARRYLKKYGVPEDVPLIVQVSRFDIWKNPLGLIEAFRLLQSAHPGAHLALVGFQEAKDNPAAEVVYRDVEGIAKKSKSIHLFFDPKDIDILEFTIMAQNGADVVVQNSIKEGFGLVVSEAMWKGQPVVGGTASGVRIQIQDGQNGFITATPEQLSKKIMYLLENPRKKQQMGKAAKATVRNRFLFPRLILDHLKVYRDSLNGRS